MRTTVSTEPNYGQQTVSSAPDVGSVSIVGGDIVSRPEPSRARAVAASVSEGQLHVELEDGRRVSVPLSWFPRLIEASDRERLEYELIGDGTLIYWPAVDEDIDVPNLLRA